MNLLFYMPSFAELPISAFLLLALSVLIFGLPQKHKMLSFLALPAAIAAVTIALLANADEHLLSGVILLSVAAGLALHSKRRDRS